MPGKPSLRRSSEVTDSFAVYPFAAFPGSDQEIRRWQPVIVATIAACKGNAEAKQQLEPELQDWEKHGWTAVVAAIRQILSGTRDLDALTDGIDRTDALIVRRILEGIQGPPPQPSPYEGEGESARDEGAHPSPSGRRAGDEGVHPSPSGRRAGDEGEGLTLDQLLVLVVAGCKGDGQAGQQAYQIAQALQQPSAQPEYAPLGKMMQRLLEGLRGADVLSGLPPELTQLAQAVEAQL
jgi:hypothetical protein